MTLVTITLTEDEQEVLLKMADEVANERGILTPWESVAEKIRTVRDASPWEEELPAHPPCGICGVRRDIHPAFLDNDARPESDHAWQWLTKPPTYEE